jgi:hypothetical protein
VIYVFRRDLNGAVDLYRYDDADWKPDPIPVVPLITTPFTEIGTMQMIALALLLDWFGNEDEAERKAVALSAGVGGRLAKLATRRQVVFTNGKTGWDISEDELVGIVAEIMVIVGEAAACPTKHQVKVIEYMGHRRDRIRMEVLAETTPRRLMN